MKTVYHFLNTGQYAGAENVVVTIAQLVKGVHHVYVSPDGPINQVLRERGIRHLSIPKLSARTMRDVLVQDQPDIVQAHDFRASIAAAINAHHIHRYGGQIISHLHKNDARMRRWSLVSLLYRWALPKFDRVLVVSQSVIAEAWFAKALAKRAVVVANVVNTLYLQSASRAYAASPADIVVVARLSEEKGLQRLIDLLVPVAQQVPDLRVKIIGQGPLKGALTDQINRLSLIKQVTLLGYLANPFPEIKAAKISVLLSQYEGFGLAILEAELLGKPVVTTPVGGLKHLVNDQVGLASDDDQDIVAEIVRLLSDSDYRKAKGEAAYRQSHLVNDVPAFITSFQKIYGVTV